MHIGTVRSANLSPSLKAGGDLPPNLQVHL